jgi:hypothetical protein
MLHAHLRRSARVQTIVEQLFDVSVLCPPPRRPATLSVRHCMDDACQLIAPAPLPVPSFAGKGKRVA